MISTIWNFFHYISLETTLFIKANKAPQCILSPLNMNLLNVWYTSHVSILMLNTYILCNITSLHLCPFTLPLWSFCYSSNLFSIVVQLAEFPLSSKSSHPGGWRIMSYLWPINNILRVCSLQGQINLLTVTLKLMRFFDMTGYVDKFKVATRIVVVGILMLEK